jgi:hypothetical protein
MEFYIECSSFGRETKYNAHNIKNNMYTSFFLCGKCMAGKVSMNRLTNKISKNKCDVCNCKIELIARNSTTPPAVG